MRITFLLLAHLLLSPPGLAIGAEPLRSREIVTPPPGPWGQLEYYRIPLDPPGSYLQYIITPSQQVEWTLPFMDENRLFERLQEEGLNDAEVQSLLNESVIISDGEVTRIFPSDEMVLNLSFPVRERLYRFLARYEENRYCARPIYIDSENLSSWFAGSAVPRSAIRDIAELAYPTPRKRGFFFADTPFTLRRASSTLEEHAILCGLLRKQSLIVRLRLTEETLNEALGDYWSAGYKNKEVMPLLESIFEARKGGTVDLSHLLPATPRQLLNRFPTPADGVRGRFPDWFWTCYNFFHFVPRDVYADSPQQARLIAQEFETTLPPLQFGDMVLLHSGGQVIHGCIHVADDIVFTKNGADLFSPWVLMKMDDVVAYHDLHGNVTLSVHRRVESGQPPPP